MSNSPANILEATALVKTFVEGKLEVPVIKGLDLTVAQGEQLAIVGTSGSGKSTLMHLLGGLDVPTSGTVKILGEDLFTMNEKSRGILRNRRLGFIYQFHHLLPEFTALENVAMPLFIRGDKQRVAFAEAEDILEKVGLLERKHHKPSELSGGERQRTAIARALVTRPKCVLADEPTGNLDQGTANLVYETMLELNREMQTSFIVVTHDLALAKKMDRTLKMTDGKLFEMTENQSLVGNGLL